MSKPENYRPDIDGLRAVAVISVVLFHAGLGCPGGFVGVDIFFVISGYLITRILEKSLLAGRFSVMSFYERRIRRIFPALFVVILILCLLGPRFLPPNELKDLGKCIVAASAFGSNILFFHRSGYFDNSSLTEPLLHTWTLSVEEQFYIFWPWILGLLGLRWFRRWKPGAVLLIIAGTLVLSAFWVEHKPEAAFYLLPSRAWELAIGALLSVGSIPDRLKRMPRRLASILSASGLAMIVAAVFLYNERMPFPGIAALLPCAGAALVIASGEGGSTWTGRLLSVRPAVFFGLISYSLYLWHWPILVMARVFLYGRLSRVEGVLCVLLAILVSWLSWRYVERPFRDRSIIGGSSRTWVGAGLATTAAFLLFGLILDRSGGLPFRSPAVAQWFNEESQQAHVQLITSPCLAWGTTLPPESTCLLGSEGTGRGYSVVLWGDSNGAHLAPAFQMIGHQMGIVTREMTKAGCPPLMGIRFVPVTQMTSGCPAFDDNAMKDLMADRQVRVVVIAAHWNELADGVMAEPIDGGIVDVAESRHLFVESLRRTVKMLTENGRQVVLVSQVPSPQLNPVVCLTRARFNGWNETGCYVMPADSYANEEKSIDGAFAEATGNLQGVYIVHPFDVLCDSARCRLAQQGEPLYWDVTHLSDLGADLLVPELERGLKNALQTGSGMSSE